MDGQARHGGATGALGSVADGSHWFARTAVLSTLCLYVPLALVLFLRPDRARSILGRDGSRGSFVEAATAVVLLPAIMIGVAALLRRCPRGTSRGPRIWLCLWILAAIYFAGEEASWGQWLFHWDTPEALAAVNRQHETNLHNVNVWLNQKPQALAEAFIALAGFVLPAWRLARRRIGSGRRWLEWVLAPPELIPAAMAHVLTKICVWIPGPQRQAFGHPEVQELAIAWFAAWYIAALATRLLRGHRRVA